MVESELAARVAERIRELREERGLSIRELARRSTLRPEVVSRSERGVTEVTISSLGKICNALMLDLPSFFDFARVPAPEVRSPDLLRAIKILSALPPERLTDVVTGLGLLLGRQDARTSRPSVAVEERPAGTPPGRKRSPRKSR